MFHLYGVAGRVASGGIEQLRQTMAVGALARTRRVNPVGDRQSEPAAELTPPPPAGPHGGAGGGLQREALAAYASANVPAAREPLRRVADVMSQPALVLPADASVRGAWRMLIERGIGQAPVVGADGTLAGLAGRAELLPAGLLGAALADPGAWDALLARPVAGVMWTPVPAATPETDLRRVAEVLLATGLPGLPVVGAQGRVAGFVSRSDLLRAIVADPPLDLWC